MIFSLFYSIIDAQNPKESVYYGNGTVILFQKVCPRIEKVREFYSFVK